MCTFVVFTSPSGRFAHRKKPTVHIDYDADWASDPAGRLWAKKPFCFLSKIEQLFLCLPSRSLDHNTY